ncbi:MAG: peptidylprolyl isomerase [Myxococcota bacterium]
MRDSLVLGEDELRAHYEKTTLRYATRQIVLRRQPFASEAEARAEDRRLGAEGRIAAQDTETLGPAPVDRLPPSVTPEALSFSAPGQRAAVMRDGRWSLVELEEVREAEPLAFELVRGRVEQSLRLIRAQAEFHAEIDRLSREAERDSRETEEPR